MLLGVDHHLWREKVPRPVDVRAELDALVRDLTIIGQAEHLKPARVGQNRTVPAHKAVQSPHLCHQIRSGTQVEVVGVAQDQLRSQFAQIAGVQRLDRCLGANWGKGRRGNLTMWGSDSSQASVTV